MSLLLSDKYKPKTTKQIVGGDYSAMGLLSWLRSWNTPQRQFKAAMLSGPPGIGKSTLAELACAEAGLCNVLRFDSSRKRTKKALDEIEEAFSSRKIDAYLTGRMQKSKPGAVIVDDINAMVTGGADRGGVPQIVTFIKASKIPVICVCNDANNRSIKPLVSVCMHIRMQRPPLEQIAQKLLEISRMEGLNLSLQVARDVARGSGCDVRQAINELQFMSKGDLSVLAAKSDITGLTMDRPFNPFDTVATLFGCHPKDCVRLSMRVYESDTMLGPLLIQENYLKAANLDLDGMAETADAISEGDVMELASRRGPVMEDAKAVMMCAIPCMMAGAKIEGRLDFPGFLGRASTLTKNKRLVSDAAKRAFTSRTRFSVEILPFLYKLTVEPLLLPSPPTVPVARGKKALQASTVTIQQQTPAQAVATRLASLHLNRDDWDTIFDLGKFQSRAVVPATAKAALTREMKKGEGGSTRSSTAKKRKAITLPPSPQSSKRPRKQGESDGEEEEEEKTYDTFDY